VAAKPVNVVAFLAFCHPGLLARFIDFILEPVNDVLAVDVKAIEVENVLPDFGIIVSPRQVAMPCWNRL
jgi:hypothetical protein